MAEVDVRLTPERFVQGWHAVERVLVVHAEGSPTIVWAEELPSWLVRDPGGVEDFSFPIEPLTGNANKRARTPDGLGRRR